MRIASLPEPAVTTSCYVHNNEREFQQVKTVVYNLRGWKHLSNSVFGPETNGLQTRWWLCACYELLLYVAFLSFVYKVVKVFVLLIWFINTTDEMFDRNTAVISNEFVSYCSTPFHAKAQLRAQEFVFNQTQYMSIFHRSLG